MPWIPRGLRNGIVTSRYPQSQDAYGENFEAAMVIRPRQYDPTIAKKVVSACPTNAISFDDAILSLDRGRCILCGRCEELYPEVFQFDPDYETASVDRGQLVVPYLEETDSLIARTRNELAQRVKALKRSVHIRHIDMGSDGAEEWEVAALTNPVYDVQRLGIYFTASPRHADLLLVTGVGTVGMVASLQKTLDSMPDPKVVVAAGVDAISGGLIGRGYASNGGISEIVRVDVFVPGSPPTPFGLLYGILLATARIPQSRTGSSGSNSLITGTPLRQADIGRPGADGYLSEEGQ
ncbi:MAG: NADH:ubiquinone oxidoreductase [Acidimicrobiaceae bacterium]|nr:NADH:ubiquinone oxidoreductase [Acidimicrobiaceae bacterium]